MNNIYATGSSGFIGSRLVSALNSDDVVPVPHEEIFDFDYWYCRTFFYLSTYGNLSDQTHVAETILANLAKPGSVLAHILNEDFVCEHFIFVSSSSVMLPVQTPYSRAKRAAEEMILASGIKACIVRPYSCIGVGEQTQHLIPTLIRSCMEGEPMSFCPQPVHDFIDVSDLVSGLIAVANEKVTGIREFGSGNATPNQAVLELVEDACGRKANITETKWLRSYDSFDWRCRNPATIFIRTKSLVTSIREMVEAYKDAH